MTTLAEPRPNFFIAGAPKCGTTSLYHYLLRHPDVFLPEFKEPGYFEAVVGAHWERPLVEQVRVADAYRALFEPGQHHPLRGEATTTYLYHAGIPAAIDAAVPDARVILMLRDPIARAHSQYWMDVRRGVEQRSFEEVVDEGLREPARLANPHPVWRSLYATHVQAYHDRFGSDRLYVGTLEALQSDSAAVVEDVLRFLGASPEGLPQGQSFQKHNAAMVPRGSFGRKLFYSRFVRTAARRLMPLSLRTRLGDRLLMRPVRKPVIPQRVQEKLVEQFEPDLRQVEETLGRSLPELRRSWPDH